MQRFFVTPVLDRGRQYFMANFPAERKPWSRKAAGRQQKKFAKREAAEAFVEEMRREWIRRGKIELGLDSALHYDVMRAAKILSGVPGASLEKAALIFLQCVSEKELSGGRYLAPENRAIELGPRFFLLIQNEAKKRGTGVKEALEGILAEWVLCQAGRQVKELAAQEAAELEALVVRNKKARESLAEIRKEDRLMELMGQHSRAYEAGRNSILMERQRYQREWRKRQKERAAKEQSNGNGSSDLQ
jgi:hypothetical protein